LAKGLALEGFDLVGISTTSFEGSSRYGMAKSVAAVTSSFADCISHVRPTWVILAGDRAEQLGAAIASTFQSIPTAHIQAGERSGNIDGMTRHAIGRLVHLHFAANDDAAERLEKSGEEPWRIIRSGAPQLDGLLFDSRSEKSLEIQNLTKVENYILGIYHPVTTSDTAEAEGLESLMTQLAELPAPTYWIAPNNDAGASEIRKTILNGTKPTDRFIENLDRQSFAQLLSGALALVGNSSAGILEAPTFGIPSLNIGSRQADRLRGRNVIDTGIEMLEVAKNLKKVLDPAFRASLIGMRSPYGDGRSAKRIVNSLELQIEKKNLLVKKMEY
jgi:UDP-hydrolysing UDP-N-acetyl-D-glucosamine 2-epimerase